MWTIVVAGGSGRRFGAAKQFAPLAGRRVVDVACDTAARAGDGVVVVLPPDAIGEWSTGAATAVAGGSTRSESVRAGLAAVPDRRRRRSACTTPPGRWPRRRCSDA